MAKTIKVKGQNNVQKCNKRRTSKEKVGQQEILNQKSGLSL